MKIIQENENEVLAIDIEPNGTDEEEGLYIVITSTQKGCPNGTEVFEGLLPLVLRK